MAEDTLSSNSNIIEEDPFNEDKVRLEFGAISRCIPNQTCWNNVGRVQPCFMAGKRVFSQSLKTKRCARDSTRHKIRSLV